MKQFFYIALFLSTICLLAVAGVGVYKYNHKKPANGPKGSYTVSNSGGKSAPAPAEPSAPATPSAPSAPATSDSTSTSDSSSSPSTHDKSSKSAGKEDINDKLTRELDEKAERRGYQRGYGEGYKAASRHRRHYRSDDSYGETHPAQKATPARSKASSSDDEDYDDV